MSTMSGADADALDALAGELKASGQRVTTAQGRLGGSINSSPWQGPNADRFRQQWNGEYRRSLAAAAAFLANAADELARNADQQRRASGGGGHLPPLRGFAGGGGGGGGGGGWGDDGPYDEIREVIERLGLAGDVVDLLLSLAKDGFLSIEALETLVGLKSVLGALGEVADVISFVTDFAEAFAGADGLPSDERLVLALAKAGLALGVSVGASKAAEVLGAAIGSVIPVAGTTAGFIVGKIVGYGVGKAVDYADDTFGVTDAGAEAILDGYQFAKSHDFDPGAMTMDVAGDVVDAVTDVSGYVIDGASDLIGDVGGKLPPW